MKYLLMKEIGLPDDTLASLSEKQLKQRLVENHQHFVKISEIHSFGGDNSKLENLYGEDGAKMLSKSGWEDVTFSQIEKFVSNKKKHISIEYGIYMFTVLFTIFENKKSTEVLLHIIKANEEDWYKELVNQINNYFSNDKITDARLLAQYKLGQNEEEENQRFRCKSLATIYNFFVNQNGKVSIRKGKMNDLYKFITDDEAFSIEHFIISETRNKIILVEGKEYIIEKSIYKRYVNNFFNFIFVSRKINSCLGNNWLPKKIEYIKQFDISCEYSKMIIEKLNGLKI